MLDERSVQTVSTQFNIFKNKGSVDSIFYTFNNVERCLVQQRIERILMQMLKPFKRAFTVCTDHSNHMVV